MRRKKEKRNFWLVSEIGCMLNLVRHMHDRQGTTTTTHSTFVEIANEMRSFGFPNKSPTQIRRKWFQMKSAYLCYKRGNKDRILLIPEKFRQVIASFVDAEYHGIKSPPPEMLDLEPVITVPPVSKVEIPVEELRPTPAPKPSEPKQKFCPQPKADKQKRKRKFENQSDDQSYSEQKFTKLTSRLKSVQKALQREFSSRQKALMEYEHTLQQERDKNLMEFFRKSTSDILAASYSILGEFAAHK